MPKFSDVATMPVPKYACQMRLTMERAVVGVLGSTSHFANSDAFRSGRKRIQKIGNAGSDHGSGLQKIAPSEKVSFSWVGAILHHELRGAFGILRPQRFDFAFASFHSGTVVRQ